MARINRETMLMKVAYAAAERSTCVRKQVGAVIALEGRPVSIGYAGAPPGLPHCVEAGCLIGPDGGCTRTTHAEANAIAFAARCGVETANAWLVVTLSPCVACAKLILAAGIHEVIFHDTYRDTSGIDLLKAGGCRVWQLGPDWRLNAA
jgi:dCMP deaminase